MEVCEERFVKSHVPLVVVCAALTAAVQSGRAADPIIWATGPNDVTFSLDGTQDPSLPQNWDSLSANVAITRGQIRGIYNAVAETSYTHTSSPTGTLWAFSGLDGNGSFTYGTGAQNHAGLTFDVWETELGGSTQLQTNIQSRPAVMYLTDTNEYLDIIFTTWTSGGVMSYTRATPPPSIINATWSGGSGNWSDAPKWSSNPKFPANGTNGTFTATVNTGSVNLDVNATVNALTIGGTTGAWTGQVNRADKALVIAAGAGKAAAISTLQNQLASGKTSNYTGNGITSSLVAANPTTMSIAMVDNADLSLTSYRGQTVDNNSIILAAARNGDATLDNKVDALDLNTLAAHWQQTSGALWSAGDFTGDGKVDALDLNVLASNWQFGTSLQAAMAAYPQFAGVTVPEPASMGVLAVAGAILLRRRARPSR
jgi:hypothetical protein